MNNIFQTLVYQREKKKDTVLATIIWDDGSAPRGRGSQMLVGAEGLLAGTIGGGAVELKSIRLSQELLASGGSGFVREFRLSWDGELGMACGGDVTVRRQGDLMKVALYYGGTQRANLKLATFTTREVTALGG